MRVVQTLLGAGILVVPIATAFAACSSESTTGEDNGGGNGGSAGVICVGSSCAGTGGNGGKAPDSSVGGSTGQGGSGGSGGGTRDGTTSEWDGSVQDTAWFDGNWDGYWYQCEGSVDPGPPPGGTPNCPADNNLPGCPCFDTNAEAVACFTGDRKNRHRGACRDGTAKCVRQGELSTVYGACENEVLPVPGVSKGKDACVCFTEGRWRIENLWTCLWPLPGSFKGAMSTIPTGEAPPAVPGHCPPIADANNYIQNNTPPPQAWSKNWLTVDCAGAFDLCITLKAGDANKPSDADCILKKVCTNGMYSTPGVEQLMPDLPGWITTDGACAQRWWDVGGYGEMEVKGMSVECDPVPGHLFTRITYCPSKCALDENKSLPECATCSANQDGTFHAAD
jgi:hypothetical protein